MSVFRLTIFIIIAVFALVLGVLFALPAYRKEFARAEIRGVAILAEVASSPNARAKGLSGRNDLSGLEGMLFLFNAEGYHAIWMKDMRFSIDILWLRRGRVVDMEEAVPVPPPATDNAFLPVYRPDVPDEYVLELKAGTAKKYDIRIGDEVKIFFNDGRIVNAAAAAKNSESPPSLGEEFFIDTLRANPVRGSNFKIESRLSANEDYEKFAVSYKADDLTISGIMNVPKETPPQGGFPVLILNHGLIHPSIYYSGRGSKREQDFFARHGYVTIHPDYRGLASSSPYNPGHHDFYVGYTRDLLALIDALKKFKSGLIDVSRMGMWGHSMGGGMAERVMVLTDDIRAYVLFAPISADAEDNFYELSPQEVKWLRETYGTGDAGRAIYDKISPLTYFADVSSPVQIHHGTADKDVPIEFSQKIFESLKNYGKKVEFFTYYGEGHEFGDAWPTAAERALQFFDRYVKETR